MPRTNSAKKSEALAQSRYEATLDLAKKLNMNQKLWIYNGAGGSDIMSTNVSLSYGPLTGLVRNEKCNKVWA